MHVLVAEDDDSLREMVARYLATKGFRVTAVPDGVAALEAYARGDIDFVLLDVMMPRKTGFEVLAELRGNGSSTPIIMATAVASSDDIVRALEGGADDYVTKPYSLPVLAARIELRKRTISQITQLPQSLLAKDDSGDRMSISDTDVLATEITSEMIPPPRTDSMEERGLFTRLRAAADAFRKRRDEQIELGPGARIADRYDLVRMIGEGGFGVVYEARHRDLDSLVAVKLLRPGQQATSIEQFRKEAQKACRVRHENAVRVLDFGIEKNTAYFVMELLNGPTCEDEVVRAGAFAPVRATTVVRNVLSALSAAHSEGIIHRDVKPHNVVLHVERKAGSEREVPKLLDFGIAKTAAEREEEALMGSAAYIAPERIKGKPYDGRADVYGMGLILYRLLTGDLPYEFDVDDFENLAKWHLHGDAPKPSLRVSSLPPAVDKVVARLCARDPLVRPTAEEAEALVEQLIWDMTL